LPRAPDRNRSRRTRLACEIGVLLRYLFGLVGEFRSRCRRGAAVELLVQTLTEVIRTARQGFDMAAGIGVADALARSAKEQCLFDLEQLRLALNARLYLPTNELDHAMDALIVQFVRVDAERAKNLPRPRFSLAKPARRP
jgi:hypothetical protein